MSLTTRHDTEWDPKDGNVHKVTLTHQPCKTGSSNRKLSSIQKIIPRKVYPEKFLLFCCCHFEYSFVFSISFHVRNLFALLRLICHSLSGLIFFPAPLTVSDFSFNQSICGRDFSFHCFTFLSLAPLLPLLSLIQSTPEIPRLRLETDGSPIGHGAQLKEWSHTRCSPLVQMLISHFDL